jgi:hypothetical protein
MSNDGLSWISRSSFQGKMAVENQNIELHNELTRLGNELEHRNKEIRSFEEQLYETHKVKCVE